MNIANDFVDLIIRMLMWLVLLRFWLQWAQADFYNPLSQAITRFSKPFCAPFRSLLPASKRFDWASLVALFLLASLRWVIYFFMLGIEHAQIEIIILRAFFMCLDVALMALFMMLIIHVISSWIAPQGHNPALHLIFQLLDPFLRPIRRLIPPTSGLDFSVLILGLFIWFAQRILMLYY